MAVTIETVPVSIRMELLSFLKEWDTWARGKPYQKRPEFDFRDCSGLCLSWDRFPKARVTEWHLMRDWFKENGLDGHYPFNRGDPERYQLERSSRKNRRRRQFVRDAILVLEEALA